MAVTVAQRSGVLYETPGDPSMRARTTPSTIARDAPPRRHRSRRPPRRQRPMGLLGSSTSPTVANPKRTTLRTGLPLLNMQRWAAEPADLGAAADHAATTERCTGSQSFRSYFWSRCALGVALRVRARVKPNVEHSVQEEELRTLEGDTLSNEPWSSVTEHRRLCTAWPNPDQPTIVRRFAATTSTFRTTYITGDMTTVTALSQPTTLSLRNHPSTGVERPHRAGAAAALWSFVWTRCETPQ